MTTYDFDEDVENNFAEDRIPDELNPYIGTEPYSPTSAPQQTMQVAPVVSQPRKRGTPQPIKKKVCLTVFTAATLSAPAIFIH
jgi:hypothetical protein